jgi:hypothetical protein
MPLSRYTERGLLNALFKNPEAFGSLANEPTIYIALMTAAPNKNGTGGTEANYGGYARLLPEEWAGIQTNEAMFMTSEESFPTATSGSNVITHYALYDAATDGNLIAFDELDYPITITTGMTPIFAAFNMRDTLSFNLSDCPT